MAIPVGVEKVTVSSGEPLTLPDGTFVKGHIRFIAPDLAVVPTDDYTLGGEAVAELVDGAFSISLVPQDATGISPTGWSYTIIAEFTNAPGWTRYSVLSKNEPSVILSDILDSTSTSPALSSASVFRTEAVKVMGLDTGILWGAQLNNSATVGAVALTAGSGIVVDYTADDGSPTVTLVPISAQTVTITDLVSPVTWLMVSSAGAIVQQTTKPTNSQRRTHIQLGAVVISAGDVLLEQTINQQLSNPINQLYDLMDAIGPFNISGNRLSAASTNLTLAKESGTVFDRGFSKYENDVYQNDPHVTSVAAQNPVTMRYVTRTPSAPVPTVTSVIPGSYDNGGVITAIPGAGTVATIQRVFLFPENDVANQIVVQYGQTVYSSLDAAVAAINTSAYVKNPINNDGVLIGYLVMTKNCSNLSVSSQARIISAARFSENPAGVSSTLALALALSGGTMTGTINATLATAATVALASLVTGDTFDRYRRYADGLQEWGPGNAARDTNLYRMAANLLGTDDTFRIGAAGALQLGSTGDVNLYRLAADSMATDDSLTVFGDAGNVVKTTGDQTIAGNKSLTGYTDISNGQVDGGMRFFGTVGFFGDINVGRQTVTGSRGGNAALASLITALATLGLITDNTTA